MEFGCETPLLAETPETGQHFFLFFYDFYSEFDFLRSPAGSSRKRESESFGWLRAKTTTDSATQIEVKMKFE
jgi:hypothetical protein